MIKLFVMSLFLVLLSPTLGRTQTNELWSSWQQLKSSWLPSELIVSCYFDGVTSPTYTYKLNNRAGSEISVFQLQRGSWEEIEFDEVADTRIVLESSSRQLKITDIEDSSDFLSLWYRNYVPSLMPIPFRSSESFAAKRDAFDEYFTLRQSVTETTYLDFLSGVRRYARTPSRIKVDVQLNDNVEVLPEDGGMFRSTTRMYEVGFISTTECGKIG